MCVCACVQSLMSQAVCAWICSLTSQGGLPLRLRDVCVCVHMGVHIWDHDGCGALMFQSCLQAECW